MTNQTIAITVVFLMVTSGVMIIYIVISGRRAKLDARLDDLTSAKPDGSSGPKPLAPNSVTEALTIANFARTALPRMGSSLAPTDEVGRTLLRSRMVYAGYYSPQAVPIFLGVKMLLMVTPALIGLFVGAVGLVTLRSGLLVGGCLGIVGMIGPIFWLESKKGKRQAILRRGLPDALDILVICLEGGLSLQSSLKRISTELKSAHVDLALELNIVQREVQLGRTPGEAIQEMAKRTDLDEVHSLATVIIQAERFGASLVKSLRIHSEVLRQNRQQRAEEMGQKASTKVLFPTLLFIFPAMFVVILGPAAIQIARTFSDMK